MFESLSSKLDQAIKTLKGQGRITEINVANTVKEIRRALVDADVSYKIAKDITDEIKDEAMGKEILISVSPGQLFTKIVFDKLANMMGGKAVDMTLKGDPSIILMAGLQGSGKTTTTAKLGNMLKRQGRNVLLVACDVYRPAAVEQLKTLGQQIGVDVYSEPDSKNVLKIAQNALQFAKINHHKIVIVDTAGRLAVDEQMMNEIAELKTSLNPSETLFVVDAMTGQDAVNTAKAFNDRINFDGVILTKLDGDTRGGAALSVRSIVNKPIKFISTGEKPENLDVFHPDRMAQRILGFGDVISFVERAQQAFDEEEAKKLSRKIQKNQFDFEDLLAQIFQIQKMGNLKDLMGMIPGISKMMKGMEVDENAFTPTIAIIRSMTKTERQRPDVINVSRKKRIAEGSGTSIQQVNALLKQYDEMKAMMKKLNSAQQQQTMKKVQKKR